MKRKIHRSNSGQALTALIAVVGVFVLAALGLLGFEFSRYQLAQDQLKNCVDSAALAGQATLAMYAPTGAPNTMFQTGYLNQGDVRKAEAAATSAAYKIFKQNSVLGQALTDAKMPQGLPKPGQELAAMPNPLPKPQPHESMVFIKFTTPTKGANSHSPNNDANQKIINVTAELGVVPAFGAFLGLPSVTAFGFAMAAIPTVDIINAFDVSGAMDDQTNVTFIKRVWAPPGMTSSEPRMMIPAWHVDYQPVITPKGSVAEGTIASILGDPERGTNVNALPPQGLENASTAPNPLKFSEAEPATHLLRGVTNAGCPPGNCPGEVLDSPPQVGGSDVFTDMVTNLDGQKHFSGFTAPGGYTFPNIAVLVEAARGNLENPAVFAAAGLVGNPYFFGILPRPGYKALGYDYNAQMKLMPFFTARSVNLNFAYALMHTNNCQMGQISFNDHVGTSDLSTFTAPNISALYPQADFPKQSTFILPNQYQEPITDTLFFIYKELCTCPAARIWGQTSNVSAALLRSESGQRAAIDWLNDPVYHRPNADRAIVLFTNTAPQASQMAAARSAANRAHEIGIPIYVIGLAESPGTQKVQFEAYNDADADPSSGGICGIAGHGGRLIQITTEKELPQAFGNVLRQLIKLTPRD